MKLRPLFSIATIALVLLACKEEGATDAGPEYDLKAPESLVLLRVGQTAVRVSWTDTSVNEEGFEVERKTNTGNFAGRAYTTRDLAVALDSMNLYIDSTYTYRVRAIRYEEKGPHSSDAVITLTP